MNEEYMAPMVYTVELTYLAETVKIQVTATSEGEAFSRAKKARPAMVSGKIVDVSKVSVNK